MVDGREVVGSDGAVRRSVVCRQGDCDDGPYAQQPAHDARPVDDPAEADQGDLWRVDDAEGGSPRR
jgi:hypothetical protein